MSDENPNDAKKLADQPHLGAPVPPSSGETKSAPLPDESLASNGSSPSGRSESSQAAVVSGNPLFGATPSSSEVVQAESKERIEQGSRERVESLRIARDAALQRSKGGPSSPSPSQTPHAPPLTRLSHAPASPRPSTLIPYLRRLGYILSILLGAGATISFIWSTFLLPLLHASFSARRALVEQQKDRVEGLLGRLREVRASRPHAAYVLNDVAESEKGREDEGKIKKYREGETGKDESKAMIREISTSTAQSTSHPPSPVDRSDQSTSTSLIPDISPLLTSLRTLSTTRSHTSTTRTSLIAVVESYTSSLHRQLWNPRPGAGFGSGGVWSTGYGLNTLDQSLAREGDKSVRGSNVYKDGFEGEGLRDRSEEWDSVRREIRGIKGMLLGRRSMGVGVS